MARRSKGPPPKPLDAATSGIDLLERQVVRRMIDPRFTLHDVARAFWPDEETDKLFAAFPLVRDNDRSSWAERFILPVSGATGVEGMLCMRLPEIGMLCPKHGTVKFCQTRAAPIIETLDTIYSIHLEFEVVRKVVAWLNVFATLGASRHYCPWLLGVLPKDHPIHEMDGVVFREPYMSMLGITGPMRKCGEIMASALMAEGADNLPRTHFTVEFNGRRDVPPAMASESYTSQTFGIL